MQLFFLNSSGKEFPITTDSDLEIVNIQAEKSIESSDVNNVHSDTKPVDTNDFKDALLASLYSQVEFLRDQLHEKDLLIRTLIIKESEAQAIGSSHPKFIPSVYSESHSESETSNSRCDSVYEVENPIELFANEKNNYTPDDQENEDVDFNDLYLQSLRDTKEAQVKAQQCTEAVRRIRVKTERTFPPRQIY